MGAWQAAGKARPHRSSHCFVSLSVAKSNAFYLFILWYTVGTTVGMLEVTFQHLNMYHFKDVTFSSAYDLLFLSPLPPPLLLIEGKAFLVYYLTLGHLSLQD